MCYIVPMTNINETTFEESAGRVYELGFHLLPTVAESDVPVQFSQLKSTIEKHVEYTGSEVGQRLLNSWNVETSKIRKVMPRDYRNVLGAIAQAKSEGLNEEETNKRIMEVAHG